MSETSTVPIRDLLDRSRVRVGLAGQEKREVLDRLVDLIADAPGVQDADAVREAVFAREALMSTGVGEGLALPHAKTDAVRGTVAAFAVTRHPIDYEALDDQPVRLLFLLVGPSEAHQSHILLLSRISRLMSDARFRATLLEAPDEAAVLDAFARAEASAPLR